MPALSLAGQTFGDLAVIDVAGRNKHSAITWNCVCACGNKTVVVSSRLTNGTTKSCGCLVSKTLKARAKPEGRISRRFKEYMVWQKMKDRCLNPRSYDFSRYGARGIGVCNSWQKSFDAFLNDMGKRPSPDHSIERINNDGDYSPENCRWATQTEQQNNKRSTRYILYRGLKVSVADAIRAAGNLVPVHRVYRRLNAGWSTEKALETPAYRPGVSS